METLSYPKETKARKQHRCDFCNEIIVVGSKYMKSTHVYDGRIYDWKAHKYCSKLSHRMNMYDDCNEGVTMDVFMESVSEKHYEILTLKVPSEDIKKYRDIFSQLLKVRFIDKLWFVLRYYNKFDNDARKQ